MHFHHSSLIHDLHVHGQLTSSIGCPSGQPLQNRVAFRQRQLQRIPRLQISPQNIQQILQGVQQPSIVNRKSYLPLHLQRRLGQYPAVVCIRCAPTFVQWQESSHPYSSYQQRRDPRSRRHESLLQKDPLTSHQRSPEQRQYVHVQLIRDGLHLFQVVARSHCNGSVLIQIFQMQYRLPQVRKRCTRQQLSRRLYPHQS